MQNNCFLATFFPPKGLTEEKKIPNRQKRLTIKIFQTSMISNGHKVKLSELIKSLNRENIELEEKNENAYWKSQRRTEEIIKNEEKKNSWGFSAWGRSVYLAKISVSCSVTETKNLNIIICINYEPSPTLESKLNLRIIWSISESCKYVSSVWLMWNDYLFIR